MITRVVGNHREWEPSIIKQRGTSCQASGIVSGDGPRDFSSKSVSIPQILQKVLRELKHSCGLRINPTNNGFVCPVVVCTRSMHSNIDEISGTPQAKGSLRA